jgi:hypothetical protein
MKISDLLRRAADAVDQQEHPGRPDPRLQNVAQMSPASAGVEVDTVDNADAGADDEVMVPPLQLKLELLKRAVGVDNVYDNQRADEVTDNSDDELAAIRRNAGIDSGDMTAVIHGIAGEDEPLDE